MTADLAVRCGTAENLARLHYLRTIDAPDTDVADDVASFLIGDVGGPAEARQLTGRLDADLRLLWWLLEGYWTVADLDELTEDDWARNHYPTAGHETQARYERTRERVASDVEGAIRLARYRAAEARRAERTAGTTCVRPDCGHFGAHHHALGCDARVGLPGLPQAVCDCTGFTVAAVAS